MKKLMMAVVLLLAQQGVAEADKQCTTIREGLVDSAGVSLAVGFDSWGYNYQAHLFDGPYCNAYRGSVCESPGGETLKMKWNDAWLSNTDCDDDGLPDRHQGFDSYIGSGAWLMSQQSGDYVGSDGQLWATFTKVVAVPAGAYEASGLWYTEAGVEMGASIWGPFAIIQEVSNDSCSGANGAQYLSPAKPGLGR